MVAPRGGQRAQPRPGRPKTASKAGLLQWALCFLCINTAVGQGFYIKKEPGEAGEIAPGRKEERDRDRSSEGEAIVQASLPVYATLSAFTTANFYPGPLHLVTTSMHRTGTNGSPPVSWIGIYRRLALDFGERPFHASG